MRSFTLLFAGLFLLYGHVLAQSHQIKGKVMDENGVAVPNASVIIVGTTRGTVTDAEGNFSLQVSKSIKALSFSAVGMLPVEVKVGEKVEFNIRLRTAGHSMEEVVV